MSEIIIPIVPGDHKDAKRITPARHHWLEISCPQCGEVHDDGKNAQEVLFYYGDKTRIFWCSECDIEVEAFNLNRIENDSAVITKAPNFKGTIKHCFYVRNEGISL